MSDSSDSNSVHVAAGMPPLNLAGRNTSLFEFWPMWLMYLPVALQWLWLSLFHRSFTLPLIANPAIPLSGMVGVPKSADSRCDRGAASRAEAPRARAARTSGSGPSHRRQA